MTAPATTPSAWDVTEGTVDADHPWLGLASYRELQQDYFFGRDAEIDALYRRVERKALTVLFGQSGLGKTSLLHAGLFPVLRKDGMLPVSIRLDYGPSAPPLDLQVQATLRETVRAVGGRMSDESGAPVTLWEVFHDPDRAPRDATGTPIIVVLVIDQFEEMFTQGYATEAGRARAAVFVSALAAIVERWVPSAVEARLSRDSVLAERLDYERDDVRVLISLREDYLPHLEELRAALPSIGGGGMRLTRMSAKEGLEAVLGPGGALVTEDVASQIMRFVSRTRRTGTTPDQPVVEDGEVEPSLLSLFCRELNARRLAKGLPRISAELLLGSSEDILSDFYNRALCDQPPAVRAFVEDELVTDSGVRENMAVERAERRLARDGAPAGALDVLVGRRLLHIEERLGTRRVELTHDVLIPVIERSRIERHQREQVEEAQRREAETNRVLRERTRRTRVYIGGLLVIVALLGWAWINAIVAVRKERRLAASMHSQSELTGRFINGIGNGLQYAADSNIKGDVVERYFLTQSTIYLDSLHRFDPTALRVMTTMAQMDVLTAYLDEEFLARDSTHADSLRNHARGHADSAIAVSRRVLAGRADPTVRQTAYALVWWAGEAQRRIGDTDVAIGTLWSADSLAANAERLWANTDGGVLERTDTTVRREALVRARLDNELGEWSLTRQRWPSADSAFSHALAAVHRFAGRSDQADSQTAAGLTFVRFTLQVARARRGSGGASLSSSVVGLRDSVHALLRRLPPPRSDSAARSGARTRPDSEAANLSLVYDHVANDLVTTHDTAGLLLVLNDEMTIDSTLASRYHDRSALQDLAYTANRRKQARLDAHHYADAAAAYGDLVAVRQQLARLSDASHRDSVNLASALGGQAWALLLAHRPAEALTAADDALRVDPTQLFIRTNQAHALLLTGRYDDAMQIYRTYWLRPLGDGQTFGAAILGDAHTTGDFRDLATAGVRDPALARAAADLRREFPKT